MGKRTILWILLFFVLYAAGVIAYYWQPDLYDVPQRLQGSAADPYTYMSPSEIEKAENLARIRGTGYFLELLFSILVLWVMIGVGVKYRNVVERRIQRRFAQVLCYLLLFLLTVTVVHLPIRYFFYRLNHEYGLSNLAFGTWLSDIGKSLMIDYVVYAVALFIFYAVARWSPKRWWLWFWAATIPLILFYQLIQPIVIDPWFHDFHSLQNQELKERILALADQAGIPADDVYEVNMSERTNTVNAYVTGIGASTRIVLWDTTLAKLSEDEIMVIMAHEMGHYIHGDVFWGVAGEIAGSFLLFWLVYLGSKEWIRRYGDRRGIRSVRDLAALPMLLLLLSLLNVAAVPIDQAISRQAEHRADIYAMEMTGDGAAGVSGFQKLARENLSTARRPAISQLFFGSHPMMMDRIEYFSRWEKEETE